MNPSPLVLRALLTVSLLAVIPPALADMFKCVDGAGRITYTNVKTSAKGCTVLSRDMPSQSKRTERISNSGGGGDEGFRVDPSTQQSRDGGRRAILQRELASEEKLLAEARQESLRNYSQQPGSKSPSSDKVQLHERNIDALKQEISKLK